MCRILYRFLTLLARLAVRSGRSKDLEIIVLRQHLGMLHRRSNRPQLADEDRALLGAVAACGCPELCRGWSGGSSVFVDEPAAACHSDNSKLLPVGVWRLRRHRGR